MPAPVPPAEAVARGWSAHAQRGMQLSLPDGRLAQAVEANRRYLLLFHDGDEITPGPFTYHRFWFRDAAFMLAALDRYGFHAEAAEVLRSYGRRQHLDGFFFSQRQEWDANGAALWALAEHWRLTGEADLVDSQVDRPRRALDRAQAPLRSAGATPSSQGLMPASISAEHLGPVRLLLLGRLLVAARPHRRRRPAARRAGRAPAADRADGWAADLRGQHRPVARARGRPPRHARPCRPGPAAASTPVPSARSSSCFPLQLFAADDPRIVATADAIRERFSLGDAFYQGISHTGLGTYLTLQLAFVELEAGDRRALDRLQWMVDAATPTFTWPEAIHPQLGTGCMGDGHHGWAAADFLSFVRALLVREVDGGLALCTMLPDAWWGQNLEVEHAPTHHGDLSFAVRWHGDRPALLWELVPRPGQDGPVRITVPGPRPVVRHDRAAGRGACSRPPTGQDPS